MKIKSLFIALCFVSLMSTTYSANAEYDCITVAVDCGDGTGTNAVGCGNDLREAVFEAVEIAYEFCGY